VKRSLVRFAADGKTWETLIANVQFQGPVQPGSAVISPDRRQLAVLLQRPNAGGPEGILVLNIADGRPRVLNGHEEHIGSMAFSPDGTKLASVSQEGGPLKIWKLPEAKVRPRAKGK